MQQASMVATPTTLATLVGQQSTIAQTTATYPLTPRVLQLIGKLTLDEKLSLVRGASDPNNLGQAGYIPGVPRLGIGPLRLTDGPAGIRVGKPATAMPAPVAMAATFNPDIAQRFGATVGKEGRALGQDVLLSPMVNIVRQPGAGRNFETLGEDPLLAASLVSAQVKGVQQNGLIATVKHFAANNFEEGRMGIDVLVDERTLYEIYLPAFAAAVNAGAGAVMGAYNKINGAYCCENSALLDTTLRQKMGFGGFVMSDWFATQSTNASIQAGLDMEMPGDGIRIPGRDGFFGTNLRKAIDTSELPEVTLDRSVARILVVMEKFGHLDKLKPRPVFDTTAGRKAARDIAEAGAVLLKNDRFVLPLKPAALKTIAWVGLPFERPVIGGGGSAQVTPTNITSIRQLLNSAHGIDKPLYAPGIDTDGSAIPASAFTNLTRANDAAAARRQNPGIGLMNDPQIRTADINHVAKNALAARIPQLWKGNLVAPATGRYGIKVQVEGGQASLTIGEKLRANAGGLFGGGASLYKTQDNLLSATIWVDMVKGQAIPFTLTAAPGGGFGPPDPNAKLQVRLSWVTPARQAELIANAVKIAKGAPAAVVMVYDEGTEGTDRADLALPESQRALVEVVAAANPNTIVLLHTGAPVELPWRGRVPAILQLWYPGQEGAAATLRLLTGAVSPSGKLPVTFPERISDGPVTKPEQYPGKNGAVVYSEGIFVGYRHYDNARKVVAYPFGHGLTYSQFAYTRLRVSHSAAGTKVTFNIRNIGDVSATDTPQVYVTRPQRAPVMLPVRWLAGFSKVTLAKGESRDVTITLPPTAWRYYDDTAHRWQRLPGNPVVEVGQSSRILLLR
ncbi:MAG: beta-glucosidase [Armatimonadota bacterium]